MSITDWENRINAKGKSAFGVPVMVGAVSTYGTFSSEYAVALASGIEIDSAMPMILCTAANIPNVEHGTEVVFASKTVTIDGASVYQPALVYYVISTQPDGSGGVWLSLSKDRHE